MNTQENILHYSKSLSRFALFVLASAITIPAWAQQAQPAAADSQNTPPSAEQQQPSPPEVTMPPAPKEGFWGRVNPFARKVWVKKRIAPINDQLNELDQVSATNASNIKDVDSRAQAGIAHAQSTADSANQQAQAAGTQAQSADNTAQQASGHVSQLNSTVNGLDQYSQASAVDVHFHGESPVLTEAARKQLDDLASNLAGRDGYILEMEAHTPAAGGAGIQISERQAEAVERYLVTQHQIPVYRMHYVALGNAPAVIAGGDADTPERVRTSSVQIRLMENSLAAQAATPPQGNAASAGAEQP